MNRNLFDNPEVKDYRDLVVWQKGIELATRVYELMRTFPNEEKFGLIAQMRRASVSVPSNIAEGSVAELDTQLYLAVKLGHTSNQETETCTGLIRDLRRTLNGLRRKLAANKNS